MELGSESSTVSRVRRAEQSECRELPWEEGAAHRGLQTVHRPPPGAPAGHRSVHADEEADRKPAKREDLGQDYQLP